MSPFLVTALIITALLIAVGLYRVWDGPTVFDRLVAVALISANGVVVLVLLGLVFERPVYFFDITLGYALLAFLLPIALGRYFEDRDDGEARDPSKRRRLAQPREWAPQGRLATRGRELMLQELEQIRAEEAGEASDDSADDDPGAER